MEIRKVLDCLSSYPNEFWKYPVSIFYMQYKQQDDFEEIFLKFIRKLYVLLLTRYLEKPTISAVRAISLNLMFKLSTPAILFSTLDLNAETQKTSMRHKLRS